MQISPSYYYHPNLTEKEFKKVFSRSWFFLGLKSEIPKDTDFKKINFFCRSFILQRSGDDFQCFINVCPHRGSKLIGQDFGSGLIKCPYHGWMFNKQGHASIPEKSSFSQEDLARTSLTTLQVAVCGEFIFGTLESKIPLKEYLEDKYSFLEFISSKFTDKIDRNQMILDCNWKIAIENTLESYHVKSVHPETLAPQQNLNRTYLFSERHSMETALLTEKSLEQYRKVSQMLFNPTENEAYRHDFIFPNLTIATTGFTSFFIQEFNPLSINSTLFISHGFTGKYNNTVKAPLKAGFIQASKEFNRQIFFEDKEVCKMVQLGLDQGETKSFKFSKKEVRIQHFHKTFLSFLT